MDLIEAQLRLGRAPGLSTALRQALDFARSSEREVSLLALCEQSPPLREGLLAVDVARVRADRRLVEQHDMQLLDITSSGYPTQLRSIGTAAPILYLRGCLEALSCPQLAIVGSRRPTATGRLIASEFAAGLSQAGLIITSGLALGIDAAGHEGALNAGGRTIAVLGGGLDRIYPAEHRSLAARIAGNGALVSEFPPATPPQRWNFPRRNRLISGLSRALLVVEAARRSGSLITARAARDADRPVFAVPGSIRNLLAHGCHQLIRDGARLVENPAQVLQELQFAIPKQMLMALGAARPRLPAGPVALDKAYEILLDAVGFEPSGLDELVDRSGLPSQSVASMLLILELEGAVGRQADGLYVRL